MAVRAHTLGGERSKFDSRIGKRVFYPSCDVKIVAGQQYRVVFVDFEDDVLAPFVARRYVDFKGDRRWIMDPCDGNRPAFLWVSEILDQDGDQIIVGQPWNYDKFWDEQKIRVAA
jgi:hypothetical protein